MKLYRIIIKLCSPLVTPLKGDTIWGHIVWGIANHEGEEKVAEFLQQEGSEEPQLVVSSAFPSGCICRPLPKPNERTEDLSLSKYAEIKKNKKNHYMPARDYISGIPPVDLKTPSKGVFTTVQKTHNIIDRQTNTVWEKGLFTVEELWNTVPQFDIYAASTLSAERIKQVFVWAFENGYGADTSTGKGKIDILGNLEEVKPLKTGTRYMALAPFAQSERDKEIMTGIKDLRADIFVRSGKIGGGFTADGMTPYKKTVMLFDEGATFTSEKQIQIVGMLLKNIHTDSRICQSAFAPVIPIE